MRRVIVLLALIFIAIGLSAQEFVLKQFIDRCKGMEVADREKVIYRKIVLEGNVPEFQFDFRKVFFELMIDTVKKEKLEITLFVSPDYLCIGTDNDFMRIPVTPNLAFQIAEKYHCFIPSPKLVNEIYKAADVKLAPLPLVDEREMLQTFLYHNQKIEEELKGKKGLIGGIKKDIVNVNINSDKVNLYGWHKLNEEVIQNLYSGHSADYVDYSHGVRLISKSILINGEKVDFDKLDDFKGVKSAMGY